MTEPRFPLFLRAFKLLKKTTALTRTIFEERQYSKDILAATNESRLELAELQGELSLALEEADPALEDTKDLLDMIQLILNPRIQKGIMKSA